AFPRRRQSLPGREESTSRQGGGAAVAIGKGRSCRLHSPCCVNSVILGGANEQRNRRFLVRSPLFETTDQAQTDTVLLGHRGRRRGEMQIESGRTGERRGEGLAFAPPILVRPDDSRRQLRFT